MELKSNEIKAFVFDMDGTLVNSTRTDYIAWKILFEEYNVPFCYEEYVKILGVKSSEVIKIKLNVASEELSNILKRKLEYFKEIVKKSGIKAIPDVESFLKDLKSRSFLTALATGARREKFNFVFEKIKLSDYFDAYITGDDVKSGKPDPEIFIKAAEKLGVHPNAVVVIEDARNGVLAAKSAGCKCIAITTTTSRENLSEADLIINSYESLSVENIMRFIFPTFSR